MKAKRYISSIADLVSLNCHLSELNRSRRFSDALQLFARVLNSSGRSDHYTLSAAATACANLRDAVVLGAQIHARSVRTGLNSYPHVFNALLSLYAKSGDLNSTKLIFREIENPDVYSRTTFLSACAKLGEFEHACQMFDEMPVRDVALWNAMITGCGDEAASIAMRYFVEMHRLGVRHDKYSFAGVLNLCSVEGLGFGRVVHLLVIKTGFVGEVTVVNNLIRMYFCCGVVSEAYRVFEEAVFASVFDPITFNVMIDGLVSMGRGGEALVVLEKMRRASVRPTEVTFASFMSSCLDSRVARKLHAEATKLGFGGCTIVGNAVITMYSSCGDSNAARSVFESLEEKDIISWNSIIACYAQGKAGELAFLTYLKMQREENKPDEFTFGSLLASSGSVDAVEMIHTRVIKDGLSLRIEVSNALVSAYSKHEMMNLACQVFQDINCKNLISWNALISGFVSNAMPLEGLRQFSKLKMSAIMPNVCTLTNVSSICANISALRLGKQVHGFAITSGHFHDTCLGNALISMYAKGGDLDYSVKVFNTIIARDRISYNSLISAYSQHGKGEEAVQCFKRMLGLFRDVKPDHTTFTSVLSACSHTGLVDDGVRIFNHMVHDYGLIPTVDHFSCLIDILARGGFLDEVEAITKSELLKEHIKSDVWWGLFSACVAHGNVNLGRIVARILLGNEQNNASVYVLLANLYASADQWQEAADVRKHISRMGTTKKPGCSWITL